MWKIEWDDRARKELRALDQPTQRTILRYLRERIATDNDPRRFGRALRGELSGFWRYRVGAYRVICQIQESEIVVFVLRLAHRKDAYR